MAQPRSFSVFLPHYIISIWTASKLLIDTQPEKPEKTIGQLPCLTAGEVLLIVFCFFFTPILNPTYLYWLWLILKQSESSKCCSTDFRPLWLKKVLLISFGNEMWFLFVQNCCSLEWTTTQVSATPSCSSSAVKLGCHAFPPCRHAVWSSSFLIMIFFNDIYYWHFSRCECWPGSTMTRQLPQNHSQWSRVLGSHSLSVSMQWYSAGQNILKEKKSKVSFICSRLAKLLNPTGLHSLLRLCFPSFSLAHSCSFHLKPHATLCWWTPGIPVSHQRQTFCIQN